METAVRSFHVLGQDERAAIKPLTLRLTKTVVGDSYAKFAAHSPLGRNAEQYLRLLNAQYPTGEPTPGQTIKLIE